MANPEHLEILKQGVEIWNKWRTEHIDIEPDLRQANFNGASLIGVDFSGASLNHAVLTGSNFQEANFSSANASFARFSGSDFSNADFSYSNLGGANMHDAKFKEADFVYADLGSANLTNADFAGAAFSVANLSFAHLSRSVLTNTVLYETDFRHAELISADLSRADLSNAVFIDADLTEANLSEALAGETAFISMNLSTVKGLDSVIHTEPSEISIGTIKLSRGKIPESFLRGCGLSDWQIENAKLYQPNLSNEEITNILYKIHTLRAHQAIQINPLFISYSHADSAFVDKLEKLLNKKGIRFWRDIHHAMSGRLERQIERAIRLNPTVLLVLSAHSVESDWVQHEARLARNLEIEKKHDILCPIALDDSWKSCNWPKRLREQIGEYNILDFSGWNDENIFLNKFSRLIEGLDLFYK